MVINILSKTGVALNTQNLNLDTQRKIKILINTKLEAKHTGEASQLLIRATYHISSSRLIQQSLIEQYVYQCHAKDWSCPK
jgi:hypothetical protein